MRVIGRRALLLGGVSAALAACAAPSESGTATRGPSPSMADPFTAGGPTPAGAPEPSAASSTAASSATTPVAAPAVDRAALVARYAGVAPTSWGLQADGIVQALGTRDPVVALTFDACGGPSPTSSGCGFDRDLVELLRRLRVKATFFLNSRWIDANPRIADELVADPLFEIGNHGTRHMPLSVTGRSAYGEPGTSSPAEVYDEVAGNHAKLTALLGRPPRFFRSGTAHCDDVAVRICRELGEQVVNFSVNGDAGTTFTPAQVAAALRTVRGGDIVISHVNRPEHASAEGYAAGLPGLLARGLRPVTLGEHLT